MGHGELDSVRAAVYFRLWALGQELPFASNISLLTTVCGREARARSLQHMSRRDARCGMRDSSVVSIEDACNET